MSYTSIKSRLQISALLIFLCAALPAIAKPAIAPPTCHTWLSAFVAYEDEIHGQIVLKHSLYGITDWEPNSQYDGIVMLKQPPGLIQTLEVEYRSTNRSMRRVETYKIVNPFEQDPRLKQFDDFKASEFFKFTSAGTYFVRLKSDGRMICEEAHTYQLGD